MGSNVNLQDSLNRKLSLKISKYKQSNKEFFRFSRGTNVEVKNLKQSQVLEDTEGQVANSSTDRKSWWLYCEIGFYALLNLLVLLLVLYNLVDVIEDSINHKDELIIHEEDEDDADYFR